MMHKLQRGIIVTYAEHAPGGRYEIPENYIGYTQFCKKVAEGRPLEFKDQHGNPTYIPAANVQGLTFAPLR